MQQDETSNGDLFLVCGLGNLGQSCIARLKELGALVNAIEINDNINWQIPDSPDLLNQLVIGDCRHPNVLERAGVEDCRAILIVTGDDRVNIATAFAARLLNPNIRVVIRSAQENLNELLQDSLGNFAAFEVTRVPARSFAIAALGTETQGRFYLENKWLQVVRVEIDTINSPLINSHINDLNNSERRVLIHGRAGKPIPKLFYKWAPDAEIGLGDTVAYIEVTDSQTLVSVKQKKNRRRRQLGISIKWQNLQENLLDLWNRTTRTERLAIVYAPIIGILFILGAVFYWLEYGSPWLQAIDKFSWGDAINNSIVLIIGGFDNMFGNWHLSSSLKIPVWLYLFSLFLTIAGTAFSGIFYAIINERLLSYRFQFAIRRPSIPKADHVVVVGLGRLGQRVATLLQQEYKQPVVGVNLTELEPGVLPQMPVVIGNIKQALKKVNIQTAKSVIAVTTDEVLNLEIALGVRAIHPGANLAIRTFDPRFHQNITHLLPFGRVMNVYKASADVFVAAAFGENIVASFRFNNQTTLVAEYVIKENDSLNDKLLTDIAYGYGVVPILYQNNEKSAAIFMPSDDIKLTVGDRLVVVGNIKGLRWVEQGVLKRKNWLVQVEAVPSPEAASKGAEIISRISGCNLTVAKKIMNLLPQTLPVELYKYQAQRLVNELDEINIVARVTKK